MATTGTTATAINETLLQQFKSIRKRTEQICAPLTTEDYVVQPVVDVSPPKWHLGHSTWFFETFILKKHLKGYREFDPDFNYVFNSYYETIGARVLRTDRGNLSRPGVEEIYKYRAYVDDEMEKLLEGDLTDFKDLLQLGLNHEQQHQELLVTDLKYILGHNPLFPVYDKNFQEHSRSSSSSRLIEIPEGIYEIGHHGNTFAFDNELARHKVFLHSFKVSSSLVSNGDYLEFMNEGGYKDFRFWHSEGWDWVKNNNVSSPMYWHFIDGTWHHYTLAGLKAVDPECTLTHISYYEATAFAAWKKMRLPTEFEWEVANTQFKWGERWEWTESAYLPYPGFKKEEGAVGEYNGKFMVNQMVLRGASIATPPGHSRSTYRNFFHPHLRWQYTGIRLCEKHDL